MEQAVRVRPGSRHSASSCSEYERCPRRYWFAHVDRTPTDQRAPEHWRFGTVVHAGLEAAFRAVQGTDRLVRDAADDALDALRASWVAQAMPADDLAGAEQLVRRTVENQSLNGRAVLAVEECFRDRTPAGNTLAGVPDLVLQPAPGVLEIRDHKVTRRRCSALELLGDRQLNLYAWMAERRWPWARQVFASHHYPLLGEVVRVRLRPARRAATIAAVDALVARIAADGAFATKPGPHCTHCVWSQQCPDAAASASSGRTEGAWTPAAAS